MVEIERRITKSHKIFQNKVILIIIYTPVLLSVRAFNWR